VGEAPGWEGKWWAPEKKRVEGKVGFFPLFTRCFLIRAGSDSKFLKKWMFENIRC